MNDEDLMVEAIPLSDDKFAQFVQESGINANSSPEEVKTVAKGMAVEVGNQIGQPFSSPEELENSTAIGLQEAKANLEAKASGTADFNPNDPNSVTQYKKDKSQAYLSSAGALEDQADSLKNPQMTRENIIGALLTQVLPIIAGAVIAGKDGAIIGLGAGATGGKTITDELIKRGDTQSKNALAQAKEMRKRGETLEDQAINVGLAEDKFQRQQDFKREQEFNKDNRTGQLNEGKMGDMDKELIKDKMEGYKTNKNEIITAVTRLNYMIDSFESNPDLKAELETAIKNPKSAVSEKLAGEIFKYFPETARGSVEQLKSATLPVILQTLGEKLSRSTEPDIKKVADGIKATPANSVADFYKAINDYRDLAILQQVRKATEYTEAILKGNPKNLDLVPSYEDVLNDLGVDNLPNVASSDGKSFIRFNKLFVRRPDGSLHKLTDEKQINRLLGFGEK